MDGLAYIEVYLRATAPDSTSTGTPKPDAIRTSYATRNIASAPRHPERHIPAQQIYA